MEFSRTKNISPFMLIDWLNAHLAVPRIQKRCVGFVVVASAVCLVGQAGLSAYLLGFKQTEEIDTSIIMPDIGVDKLLPSDGDDGNYALLAQSTWFGVSRKLEESQIAQENIAVETTLNLDLKGTILGANPRALIRDNSSQKTHVLKVGQELMNGVQVVEISRRRIVLNNRGSRETLSLPGEDYMFQVADSLIARIEPAAGEAPQTELGSGIAKNLAPVTSAPRRLISSAPKKNDVPYIDRKITRRQKVKIGRMEVMKALGDLSNLGNEARFIPLIDNGKVSGFRLAQMSHDSLLTKLSLQEGDILVKLDDVPVYNKEKLFPMLMGMATAKEAEIVVSRGGDMIALMVEIRS